MTLYQTSAIRPNAEEKRLPIAIDLDGTLVLADTLHESAVIALFRKPHALAKAATRIGRGRHALKAALAAEIDLTDVELPLREDLLEWLRKKAGEGHELHLFSAADQSIVDSIAARIGIFASAVGSTNANLKGAVKAKRLQELFPQGFIYVGDHHADLQIWRVSEGIVLAGVNPVVARKAAHLGKPILAKFDNPPLDMRSFFKAIRVHHWSKNVLLFVPLILAHQWTNWSLWLESLIAFICVLAVTSATYLVNDISDLDADRRHWSKRQRALASGRLSIRAGLGLAAALLVGGFVVGFWVSYEFGLALLAYFVLTGAYSMGLKRVPLLDTLTIGLLFTIRLVMGAVLIDETHPAWLLTFAVFFFFSLAMAKRHTEIIRAASSGASSLKGRGYEVEDAPLTLAVGTASAIAALVVMLIFVLQELLPSNDYTHPALLTGIPLLLSIWLGRIWLLSHRGRMNDDPVSFALRDRVSLGLGAVVGLLFAVAL